MTEVLYMIKRNVLVYLRDRSAVFFSLLSALIVVLLMVFFLGSMGVNSVTNILSQYGGVRDAEKDLANSTYLIRLWILAGIIVVNSISVPLTIIGRMVNDEENGRTRSFFVTGVSRVKLTISYIASAWIIGTVMCTATLAMGEIFFAVTGYGMLGFVTFAKAIGIIAVNCFVYSSIGYMVSILIHSSSAWSGFLTVMGTVSGFLGGTYVTVNSFSENVQNVLKALPVLHGTAMLRAVLTEKAADVTFDGVFPAVRECFDIALGVRVTSIGSAENVLSGGFELCILLGYAIIPLVAAVILDKRRKLKDR